MDIYEYLKMDHEHVNSLFKQFEKSKVPARKVQIATMIAQELLVHAKSEQEMFYKALEPHFESRPEVLHGIKEHAEIEDQIIVVLDSKNMASGWQKNVEKLKDLVTHHVKEEERDIFKEAKKVLSDEEAYELKEKMHYLKQDMLRRLEKVSKLEE